MTAATLPPGWQAFERLQHFIDSRIVTPIALGGEEALSDLLDDFTEDFVPTADYVHRRFQSLRRNRVRKQRRRGRLLFEAAPPERSVAPSKRMEDRDELRFASHRMTASEWALFEDIASGAPCGNIARDNGMSPGQLRTRLCRLRARLQPAA